MKNASMNRHPSCQFSQLMFLAGILLTSLFLASCDGDEEPTETTITGIKQNTTVSLTFDDDPGDVRVNDGIVEGSGNERTISQFSYEPLELTISWSNKDATIIRQFTETINIVQPTITVFEPEPVAEEVCDDKPVELSDVAEGAAAEWRTRIIEYGDIPVLNIVTVTEALCIQIADRKPAFCVSLNHEEINGVHYTAHGSTWIRITEEHKLNDDIFGENFGEIEEVISFSVIESTIAEDEICGITDNKIRMNLGLTRHSHRLVIDMTVDGERGLYVSPSTFSRNQW